MIEVDIQRAGYQEGQAVITDVRFSIAPGEMVGLIGGNGAGKSTTIQTLMETIAYSEATLNLPPYGYVPERPIFYTYYTLREHIHLLAQLAGDAIWERALALCELFRLSAHLDEYPTSFSKGMQQKVMLILAFAPRYAFYILDEPFMGLDPQAIRRLLVLLEELQSEGASILISTHALDTAEKICDRFLCMHEGKLIRQGTLQEMQTDGESLLDVFDALIEGELHV